MRFADFASDNPEAVAVVDALGKTWSRGDISHSANAWSRALQERGVGQGGVLAILAPNCAEYMVVYLAATQIGMHVVPINWHLAAPEIQYILDDCRAQVFVVHEKCSRRALAALSVVETKPIVKVSIGGDVSDFDSENSFIGGVCGSRIENAVDGRVLSYTSATTGRPKGVVLQLRDATRVLDLAISRRMAVGTRPEEHTFLCYSMLYHGSPLENVATALHMGQKVVLAERFDAKFLLELIDGHKITQAFIVPTMFTRLLLLDESSRSRYSISSLQRVLHGGAPCPPEIKRRMIEWWGPILWESYGATEGSGTIVSSEDWLRFPGTVGRPIPGTCLKIVGDDGSELADGQVGLIYMSRYSGDRFEYLGDPEKTAESHRGELFTVGDLGYRNDEGFLFLCGRKIDMICLSGMKVYAAEIECVLMEHSFVADCAVIGVPDPLLGEAIVAFIQPSTYAPGEAGMKAEMIRHLSSKVSLYKCPKEIVLLKDIGREGTGKLRKRNLRDQYLSSIDDLGGRSM